MTLKGQWKIRMEQKVFNLVGARRQKCELNEIDHIVCILCIHKIQNVNTILIWHKCKSLFPDLANPPTIQQVMNVSNFCPTTRKDHQPASKLPVTLEGIHGHQTFISFWCLFVQSLSISLSHFFSALILTFCLWQVELMWIGIFIISHPKAMLSCICGFQIEL